MDLNFCLTTLKLFLENPYVMVTVSLSYFNTIYQLCYKESKSPQRDTNVEFTSIQLVGG